MEVYSSIDNLPVYYFDQINKTGDYSLLVKTKSKKINQIELEKTWEKIYNEFIKEFGISEQLLKYIKLMKEAIQHYEDAYVNGNRVSLNFAKVAEFEAEQIFKQASESPNNVYAIVSKGMGFRINPLEISTREFYNYLKLISTTKGNGKEN